MGYLLCIWFINGQYKGITNTYFDIINSAEAQRPQLSKDIITDVRLKNIQEITKC